MKMLHQVVMLPSKEKATAIGKFMDTGTLLYNRPTLVDIPRGMPQDLYFVRKGSITSIGESFIGVGNVIMTVRSIVTMDRQYSKYIMEDSNGRLSTHIASGKPIQPDKVITATTNSKLNKPKISDAFIESYVASQGKMKEVLVDYEQREFQWVNDVNMAPWHLKIRSDGAVISFVPTARMYTRDDMRAAFNAATNNSSFDEWIKNY